MNKKKYCHLEKLSHNFYIQRDSSFDGSTMKFRSSIFRRKVVNPKGKTPPPSLGIIFKFNLRKNSLLPPRKKKKKIR